MASTSEQNPSLARSRSRYRRNRPTDAIPPPAIPTQQTKGNAQTKPTRNVTQPNDEEDAREAHRQNTMDQLTGGGNATTHPRRKETSRAERSRARDTAPDTNRKSFFDRVKLSKVKAAVTKSEPVPKYIGVGGTGVVPGVDAPKSAVNAGERRVMVEYGDASASLTITPSTSVQDLLLDAKKRLSKNINHEKFIVMESFCQLGLERPLRRFERIRDVMNSWATDAENRFIVIPPSSVDALAQLDAAHVPSEHPPQETVYLYHSQRRRRWDKRYVTMRSDGQVTIAKKENSKDHTNICHLSDFDIYFPSARALSKDIKPPKKICFAIKSQQKSSMFLSTENFVHFFSTSDKAIADKWYRVTQQWRSWYLLNMVGVAEKSEVDAPKRSGTKKSTRQHKQVPVDIPLLQRDARPDSSREGSLSSRKKTARGHGPLPPSYPQDSPLDHEVENEPLVQGVMPAEVEAATFAPSGLLGRTYTQRQNAMREREDREKRSMQDPFTGAGLISTGSVHHDSNPNSRTNTMTRPPDMTLFNRSQPLSPSNSFDQKNKPLVDLTPVFVEPPQHSKKGKGHGVKVEPGMQLIEGATGPDLGPGSVAIPSATSWRRPPADTPPQRRSTTRSVRHPPKPYAGSNSADTSPVSTSNQFTPNSLLACTSNAPTPPQRKGHGVATGDRNATKPLLDMSPENPFADGSLLRHL
ncbi:uncharacterized protein N7511_000087 [Penicillium nucicola]|uniref:uncharacterized protein n=1 Tax=Penicillium nucicola TaxID=1850975 RepID=UPI0025452E01|nr:uncharacterized protein N7511_000087 [Penicillium nucicola]KAJ5775076.1 hypothetical protein N7511_000087 [Penicillium nucicola]